MLKVSQSVCFGLMTLIYSVSVSAHMELQWPPGINSKFDPQTPQADIDYSMTSPLLADGSNYPCKGYNTAANIARLNPVGTLKAGSTMNITLAGSATHGGGSCQFAISYDQGTTFAVVASIIGGCPLSDTYDFPLPADLPSTDKALFAWTWNNHEGNREEYMNCAVVSIDGTGSSYTGPSLFRADTFADGTCLTVEGEDPVYPNPGPSVQYMGSLTASSPVTVLSPCSFDQDTNVSVGPSGSSSASLTSGSSTSVTGESSTSSSASATSTSSTSSSATATSATSTLVAAPTSVTSASSASDIATSTSSTASAPESTATTVTDGSVYIKCTSTTTFSLCVGGGSCTVMGAVADGTTCVDGQITKKKMKRSKRGHEMKRRLGGHR